MAFETNSFNDRKNHSSCCFASIIFEQFFACWLLSAYDTSNIFSTYSSPTIQLPFSVKVSLVEFLPFFLRILLPIFSVVSQLISFISFFLVFLQRVCYIVFLCSVWFERFFLLLFLMVGSFSKTHFYLEFS